jgi:hypothetical protein
MVQRLPFFLLVSLALCGCGIGYRNGAQEQRPEIITGMGATVMYPGEPGPAMPGSAIGPAGSTSSSSGGSMAPGTTSGSSNSSGTGVPGAGTSSGSSSSSGSGSESPAGSNLTMIGQTTEEASSSQEKKQFLPIGPLFGYPFFFLGQTLGEKADEAKKAQMEPKPQAAAQTVHTADDVERDRLMRENEALRKELEQHAQSTPPVSAAPSAPHAAIGDELAALERSLNRRNPSTAQASPAPATTAPAAARANRPLLPNEPGLGAPETRDRNGDGRPDEWIYTANGRPVTDAVDDDFDGSVDRIKHYDSKGRLVSADEDLNGDGIMETTSIYEDGKLVRRRTDSNGDGQADTWSFYDGDELLRTEIDKNGDGFRDEVTIYAHGKIQRVEEDRNGDGRPDVVSIYRDGQLVEKREDLDFDGTPDVVSHYESGKLISREASSAEVFQKWENEGTK